MNKDLEYMNSIVNKLLDAIRNVWNNGSKMRIEHQVNNNIHTIIVSNHLADFNSKYNLNKEYIHATHQWFIAQNYDKLINQNLNIACNDINNNVGNIMKAKILEPGNIIQIKLN